MKRHSNTQRAIGRWKHRQGAAGARRKQHPAYLRKSRKVGGGKVDQAQEGRAATIAGRARAKAQRWELRCAKKGNTAGGGSGPAGGLWNIKLLTCHVKTSNL